MASDDKPEQSGAVPRRRGNPAWLPGVSANPAGRAPYVSRTKLTASILADLLSGNPDASPSARVLLATAARLLALSQLSSDSGRSLRCAAEARSLIKQAKATAKPKQESKLSTPERLRAAIGLLP